MKKLIRTLSGGCEAIPPIWLMRQAGRYLPEYRAIKEKSDSFWSMCYNPNIASDITLQPIKRFNFDAAIIFADILVVPQALGTNIKFKDNVGPIVDIICDTNDLSKLSLSKVGDTYSKIYQTVKNVKENLSNDTALIGFSGGIWSVMAYMLQGKAKDFSVAKKFIYENKKDTQKLIAILTEATIIYLEGQINAGIEVIQIFESWALALNYQEFFDLCIKPTNKIITYIRDKYPHIKIIGFPRGSGVNYKNYMEKLDIDAISVDYTMPISWIKNIAQNLQKNIGKKITIQGNLDPTILAYATNQQIKTAVTDIIKEAENIPFIFNLGHGILPNTAIENVELLMDIIRNNK